MNRRLYYHLRRLERSWLRVMKPKLEKSMYYTLVYGQGSWEVGPQDLAQVEQLLSNKKPLGENRA